jgi:hypothetical protein
MRVLPAKLDRREFWSALTVQHIARTFMRSVTPCRARPVPVPRVHGEALAGRVVETCPRGRVGVVVGEADA